ncbi:MAG: hypothetical protein QOJ70_2420 [Acidobacteriota bacterium]|jgi:protein-S-isoprenylcysteine O-methyltransferase Ste14|nr:hypothetical protein [Acidobacteriota bacterium]
MLAVFSVGFVVAAARTLVRVRSEEKLLRETFGTDFDNYARRDRAFIPGLLSICA